MVYSDKHEKSLKELLEELNQKEQLLQDDAIELLEDVLIQMKMSEYRLPSLKQALD